MVSDILVDYISYYHLIYMIFIAQYWPLIFEFLQIVEKSLKFSK